MAILKKSLKEKVWCWSPPVLYALFIFFLSSVSTPQVIRETEFPFIDKLLHLIEYAILGYLVARTLFLTTREARNTCTLIVLAGIIGLAYGVTDEMHQWFVPLREASVMDVVCDGLGSVIGGIFYVVQQNQRKDKDDRN